MCSTKSTVSSYLQAASRLDPMLIVGQLLAGINIFLLFESCRNKENWWEGNSSSLSTQSTFACARWHEQHMSKDVFFPSDSIVFRIVLLLERFLRTVHCTASLKHSIWELYVCNCLWTCDINTVMILQNKAGWGGGRDRKVEPKTGSVISSGIVLQFTDEVDHWILLCFFQWEKSPCSIAKSASHL